MCRPMESASALHPYDVGNAYSEHCFRGIETNPNGGDCFRVTLLSVFLGAGMHFLTRLFIPLRAGGMKCTGVHSGSKFGECIYFYGR